MAGDSISTMDRDGNHSHTTSNDVPAAFPSSDSPQKLDYSAADAKSHSPKESSHCEASGGAAEVHSSNPFTRLPASAIERILYFAEPSVFASLTLLNREWRRIASSPKLYRRHLAHCHGTSPFNQQSTFVNSDNVSELRRALNREARRNLFDVFLRPRQTLVKLISSSTSSSSAFPHGEAFRFTFSAHGRMLLSLSSSRIFVVDVGVEPISVLHELKTLRRPVAATISDDGTTLAVASSERQVNIYMLTNGSATLTQSISPAGVPRVLEFSPEGSVLSVAYDGGVEVFALGESALPTDRRAVRCSRIDHLTFSRDGLMLLGSSRNAQFPNLVTISPPLYIDTTSSLSVSELRSRMWTTQMLFPEVNLNYSHVTTVPSAANDDGGAWVVAYDWNAKAFRMLQVDGPQRGSTYFVGPGADSERDEPGPSMIPTSSEDGDLLAIGFYDSEIWLYGLSNTSTQGESRTTDAFQSHLASRCQSSNFNRLKKMIEGSKTLVHGHSLASLEGVTAIKWIKAQSFPERPFSDRLVAVAPGGVNQTWSGLAGEFPVDGGRIMLFDFSCSASNGEQNEVTIEVGEADPTPLAEPGAPTLDVEVELERRRTRINRRAGLDVAARYSIPSRAVRDLDNILTMSPTSIHRRNSHSQPNSPTSSELAAALTFIDNPYSNTAPRSRDTLNRAATAAASNRGRSRYENTRFAQSNRGRMIRQIPHESDADNWVPPPPPYTQHPSAPLPEHLQRLLMSNIPEPDRQFDHLRRSQSSPLDEMLQAPAVLSSGANLERVTTSPTSRSGQDAPGREVFTGPDHENRTRGTAARGQASDIPITLRAGVHESSLPQNMQLNRLGEIVRSTDARTTQPSPAGQTVASPPHPSISTSLPAAHWASPNNSPTQQVSRSIHTSNHCDSPRLRHATSPSSSNTHTPAPRPPLPASNTTPSSPSRRGLNLNFNFNLHSNNFGLNSPSFLHQSSGRRPPKPGVERSRSRSQDVPRRRHFGGTNDSGPFDARIGRRVLTSQSDAGIQPPYGGRHRVGGLREDWERVDAWEGKRKWRDLGRCILM
ncbi:hypothetical protein VTO42DRAFT_4501 [Malbranchea cinnamomea]